MNGKNTKTTTPVTFQLFLDCGLLLFPSATQARLLPDGQPPLLRPWAGPADLAGVCSAWALCSVISAVFSRHSESWMLSLGSSLWGALSGLHVVCPPPPALRRACSLRPCWGSHHLITSYCLGHLWVRHYFVTLPWSQKCLMRDWGAVQRPLKAFFKKVVRKGQQLGCRKSLL